MCMATALPTIGTVVVEVRCDDSRPQQRHLVFCQRNLTVVAAAFTGGRECYICLCADGSVISLGCACRGAASAHLGCAVEAAVHAEEQCQQQTGMLSWCTCALCHQDYTGPMQMGLSKEGVRRVQHLLERDEKRLFANNNLAAALLRKGNYAQAEVLFANCWRLPAIIILKSLTILPIA